MPSTQRGLQEVAGRIVLVNQRDFSSWWANTKDSVPRYLWKYFDPDKSDEIIEPNRPVRPTPEGPLVLQTTEGGSANMVESAQDRKARLDRTDWMLDRYYEEMAIYNRDMKEFKEACYAEVSLKRLIKDTISKQKDSELKKGASPRAWLATLVKSTKPSTTIMRDFIRQDYRKIRKVYKAWPTDGPGAWIGQFLDILNQAEEYELRFDEWLSDFCICWGEVPQLHAFVERVEEDISRGNDDVYDRFTVTNDLLRHWHRTQLRNTERQATKPRPKRFAFIATDDQIPRFDGQGAESDENKPDKKEQKNNKRPHDDSGEGPATTSSKKAKKKCEACGMPGHTLTKCFLVNETPDHTASEYRKRAFEKNMDTNPELRKQVEDIRARKRHANAEQ